jgi:hypothetical protein
MLGSSLSFSQQQDTINFQEFILDVPHASVPIGYPTCRWGFNPTPVPCCTNSPWPLVPAGPPTISQGVTFSGGEVQSLIPTSGPIDPSNSWVVYTINSSCVGDEPTITINFNGTVSNVSIQIGMIEPGRASCNMTSQPFVPEATLTDDQGDSLGVGYMSPPFCIAGSGTSGFFTSYHPEIFSKSP